MADKDFRIDMILGAKFAEGFKAIDAAKSKLEGLEKSAGKFSNGAGAALGTSLRVAGAAAIAAATASAAIMGLYIAKTIEAEKVQTQLASRIKDTAGIAGRSLEELNATSKKLSLVTVFDDEAIGNVQAMLLTFKEIRGVQLDKSTEAVLNLSTAMGTDLNSAALQVGKALNDPIGGIAALSRAGVQFTNEQKEVIKSLVETGQVAKAQEVILAELEGQMGTAARAARDTLGGALQALQNAFDDLMEGDTGDTGIVGTREAVESLIATLNDPGTKNAFNSIVNGIVAATSALIDGTSWWVKWGQARNIAMSGGDITGVSDEGASKRLSEIANQLNRLAQPYALSGKKLDTENPLIKELMQERDKIIEQLKTRNRKASQDALAAAGVNAAFDAINSPTSTDVRDPRPPKTPKAKAGSKSDPDSDIKNRIASLKEEAALLGQIEEGETKASKAAEVRYAITEGEFKNKSPALKAELLAAAEAADAANDHREAESERQKAIEESQAAYEDLMRALRTPAEVAVDDAISKLNTLTEAMGRGETGGVDVAAAQKKIIDASFEPPPDSGFSYDPFSQFEEQARRLEEWRQDQLESLETYRAAYADRNAEWNAREEQIEAQHQNALRNLQVAQAQVMLGAASAMFGSLADIAKDSAGEQSKAYKVLFAISKGFAIANAALGLANAISNAMAVPYPANIPLIVAAFTQGAQLASVIASATYSGGSGYAEGGWTGPGNKHDVKGVVHADEGVLTKKQIAKLGGPAGFYRLSDMIDEGSIRERMQGWVGYAEGGLVGAPARRLKSPDYASYPQGAAGLSSSISNDMRVYLSLDEDTHMQRLANHPAFAKAVIAVSGENGGAIKASWGNG